MEASGAATSTDSQRPRLWTTDGEGNSHLNYPQFEYTTLNQEIGEHRFFVLHPPVDGLDYDDDHVRCELITVPLSEAPSFIAIKNARGYRLLIDVIEVDGKALVIPAAIERFLRHFRKLLDKPTPLWIRHLSLNQPDAEERNKLWTRELSDQMYAKATEVVDMSEFNTTLFEKGDMKGVMESEYSGGWSKKWYGAVEVVMPKVFPIRLGKVCMNPEVDPPVDDHDYVPLDIVAHEIRVVILMPSPDPSAPLVLHMGHSPLYSGVTYAALSYRWGTDETTEEINLNGLKKNVRKSLADLLRSLRYPDIQQPLWIDAVSINQDDVMERNRQVPRMGDIYDFAKAVICYTGLATDDSDLALEFIKKLRKPMMRLNKDREWHFGEESYDKENGWTYGENPIRGDLLATMCAALYKFLTRPYFGRLWVLQEWAWATNPVIVVGGNHDTSFEDLDVAAYNFLDMIASDPTLPGQIVSADTSISEVNVDLIAFPRKLSYFRHLASRGSWRSELNFATVKEEAPGFLETLIIARDFQCVDPRDKIFGLWNLARDKKGLDFKMDYTKSVQDTYADFARAWAAQHRELDILGAVEITPATQSFYENAPSWCPDWSTPSTASCLVRKERIPNTMMFALNDLDGKLYNADGGVNRDSFDEPLFTFEDNVLHCTGVILDQIKLIFEEPPEMPKHYRVPACDPISYYKFQTWTAELARYCTSNGINTYNDPLQAATAMFHGDSPSAWPLKQDNPDNADDERHPDEVYVCIPTSRQTARDPNSSRHVMWYGGSYDRTSAWDVVKGVLRGRRPFMSENGYMGLCPSYITADSSELPWNLAIVAGCSVPLLLREREDGSYQLCGSCFVQGWMDGEALLEMMGAESAEEFWDALRGGDDVMRIY
ncbi:hypothetical protein M409DRAFT_28381 [Zasmidium cellare ATCC 36951]|uniref:Heterokaryon incompatibility domain-containing protein n=1 Tax=Zasmidium cellare ATCC 36951 TaxID=1080233 RepID=A0A6A6C2X0_ZASCE|nr:uncharacterized protein M409DRAFT_28381 [Zasmidium cellare ATCC 36951]KAF2161345.1 hypothetical protein M409DRAFT_28381 [Zasmidium cellare ATCC 36951]